MKHLESNWFHFTKTIVPGERTCNWLNKKEIFHFFRSWKAQTLRRLNQSEYTSLCQIALYVIYSHMFRKFYDEALHSLIDPTCIWVFFMSAISDRPKPEISLPERLKSTFLPKEHYRDVLGSWLAADWKTNLCRKLYHWASVRLVHENEIPTWIPWTGTVNLKFAPWPIARSFTP